LAQVPKQAVPFLNGRLEEAIPNDTQLRRWIAELDSDDFEARQAADKELTRRGELIEPAALAKQSLNGVLQHLRKMAAVQTYHGCRIANCWSASSEEKMRLPSRS
jgi:hypothetical protein